MWRRRVLISGITAPRPRGSGLAQFLIPILLTPVWPFAQPAPRFDAAAIRVSPPSSRLYSSGPYFSSSRYEYRNASLLDLISTAYGVDQEKVFGGPSSLDWDRFDVIAKLSGDSTKESRKLMLQVLLADRFGLTVHNDTRPLPAFALSAGKHAGLKEADPKGEPGCKLAPIQRPADGGPPVPTANYTCRNMTMAAFAAGLPDMRFAPQTLQGKPVADSTGLAGAWDFNFHFSPPMRITPANPAANTEIVTLSDAIEKQLGLRLEPAKVPLPVLVVDRVNPRPSPNPPDLEKSLPAPPTEFEVAEIKPAQPTPNARGGIVLDGAGMVGGGVSVKNGRVMLTNFTLKGLIAFAWNLDFPEQLADVPKGLDVDHYDVIAKAPHDAALADEEWDFEPILPMLQKLLIDRFKLAIHTEQRPVNGYSLVATKPKMQAADPASRTQCLEGPGPDGKDPRIANPALSRLMHCQNVSMDQFAALISNLAGGYFQGATAVNATGLQGGYDFTLSFSAAGVVNGAKRLAGSEAGTASAADPSGGLSLYDALTRQLGLKLEAQKSPRPVYVIDHVELKPTDN